MTSQDMEGRSDTPLVSPSRGLVIASLAIMSAITLMALWATMTSLSGAVVGNGRIVVEQDRQIVQHPDGGVVKRILVQDGQKVDAGEILIELDGEIPQNELAVIDAQYFELRARRGRLEAERALSETIEFPEDLLERAQEDPRFQELIDRQSSLFHARRTTLEASRKQLKTQSSQIDEQVNGNDAQLNALAEQSRLIGSELKDQKALLSKGLTQVPRVLALEREAASLQGRAGEITSARAAAKVRQSEIELSIARLEAQYRESAENALQEMSYRELELGERRSGLRERINRLDIRAPSAGIIYQLRYKTPSSVISPADPILYIVPQDRPLLVETQIAVSDIDEISVGQTALVRFGVFSSRAAPELFATVTTISADALVDEATNFPYYRATLDLPPAELKKLENRTLLPGMQVEVFIQTGERTPLSYLSKPLTDYFVRALRE